MLEKNIDTVVLGCTHYPFVIPLIEEIVGDKVRVKDPAPSVAKQVKRLLEAGGRKSRESGWGEIRFYTSGNPQAMKSLLPSLLGESGEVERVEWDEDTIIATLGRSNPQHHEEIASQRTLAMTCHKAHASSMPKMA